MQSQRSLTQLFSCKIEKELVQYIPGPDCLVVDCKMHTVRTVWNPKLMHMHQLVPPDSGM